MFLKLKLKTGSPLDELKSGLTQNELSIDLDKWVILNPKELVNELFEWVTN